MTDREKLIKLIYRVMVCRTNPSKRLVHEQSEFLADHLLANGVTTRPKGKWRLNKDGSGTCSECNRTRNDVWDMDNWDNFCSHCGADMREGEG